MYILPSGLTAAPNKESHGGADRLTCPSVALCADNALMPNTTRQALKKNPICLLVRLRFKLFLPDSVLVQLTMAAAKLHHYDDFKQQPQLIAVRDYLSQVDTLIAKLELSNGLHHGLARLSRESSVTPEPGLGASESWQA